MSSTDPVVVPGSATVLPAQVSPPRCVLSAHAPHELPDAEVIALPVLPTAEPGLRARLGPGAAETVHALGVDADAVLRLTAVTGKAGEVASVPTWGGRGGRLLLLVGVGDRRPDDLRRAGAALARACRDRPAVATTLVAGAAEEVVEAFVAGVVLGSFTFHWRSTGPEHTPVARVVLASTADLNGRQATLDRAQAVAEAAWRSRMLACVPASLKTPQWLAEQAESLAAGEGLDCQVWDEHALAEEGFGGLLAVGRAAAAPPRLIRLDYRPARGGRRGPRLVLVGKGITFDTGGLSIKTAENMVTMKRDMTGGGVVIAVMATLRRLRCPVRVTGLVAAAENAVGADALRPGDVVRHWGGRTSEVTNTDAEGRLVLADALAYATSELRPAAVVDVATLTGAMRVALGQRTGGLFATSDALAERLLAAGEQSGERLWRMPLAEEYEDKLASKVADADNAPGGPGAITAALFLRHFVGDVPWAHLDIASVGDAPADQDEWTAGPTGFGARLLLRWLGRANPLEGL